MKYVLDTVEPPYSPEIAEALSRYPQSSDGYIIKLFRVFANSTRFLTKKGALNLLDKESPLSIREREIVILRTTANKNCEYEWGVHVMVFGKAANLDQEQINATRNGDSDMACWKPEERLLIECVDQLCMKGSIEENTIEKFQQTWTLEQQLEIFALCGNYHLISFVANSSRIGLEPMSPRFPT